MYHLVGLGDFAFEPFNSGFLMVYPLFGLGEFGLELLKAGRMIMNLIFDLVEIGFDACATVVQILALLIVDAAVCMVVNVWREAHVEKVEQRKVSESS